MAQLNERLAGDKKLRDELRVSIEGYEKVRDALDALDEPGHPGGGPDRIKCLHAHTAQHLVTADNPVGKAVLQELDWTDPNQPCI
jgi:hypothetical protein